MRRLLHGLLHAQNSRDGCPLLGNIPLRRFGGLELVDGLVRVVLVLVLLLVLVAARTVAGTPSSAPETVSKNFSPAAMMLPPVLMMKGTKLLSSPYFATLMSLYTAAAWPGVLEYP